MRFMMALLGWVLLALDSLLHSGFFALLGLSLVVASAVSGFRETKRRDVPGPNMAVARSGADGYHSQPDVTWRFASSYVEWDNHRVRYLGTVEGQVLGYSADEALASELGWILKNGHYEGQVPLGSRRHIVHERLKGELDGEEVSIIAESDDYYKVSASGGEIIRKWKLYMWDKCEWEGAVPKHAFSRVWVDERRRDC